MTEPATNEAWRSEAVAPVVFTRRSVLRALGAALLVLLDPAGMVIFLPVIGAVVALMGWVTARARRQLAPSLRHAPFAGPRRPHLVQAANRITFWSLAGWCGAVAIPSSNGRAPTAARLTELSCAGLCVVLSLVPRRVVLIAPNVVLALGSIALAHELVASRSGAPASALAVSSPVRGRAVVINGGRSLLTNGHRADGSPYRRQTIDLDAPPGTVVVAPASGDVRVNGREVVIALGRDRWVVVAGLATTDLVTGQSVSRGEPIGTTGKGVLAVRAQDDAVAHRRSTRAIALVFTDVAVRRRGHTTSPELAYLRRNDILNP